MANNDPTNAGTRAQIRNFLEKAVENAKNPDPREQIKKIRIEKAKKEVKRYGF
jgi:hypothetical protein